MIEWKLATDDEMQELIVNGTWTMVFSTEKERSRTNQLQMGVKLKYKYDE